MPYDACYITQEVCWPLYLHLAVQTNQSRSVQFISIFCFPQNGSYVAPVLWFGHPLKLLCPVQTSVPFLSPSDFCSSFGMAFQIDGQQPDISMMKVISEFKAIDADFEEMYFIRQVDPTAQQTDFYSQLDYFKNIYWRNINILYLYSRLEH